MKYKKLNDNIIELVGGKENIKAVAHCVTRLRLTLNDRSLAKTETMKQLEGVIDVVSNDVAYQIVIGTHVSEVYNEFIQEIGIGESNQVDPMKRVGIKGIGKSILVVISETMSSIIEVLLAAGLLAGFLSLFTMIGIISIDSPTYQIFDTLRVATFHFLPVLIAASAAKRLNVNPYLAIVLAVTLLSANIDGIEGLSLFGLQLQPIVYANSFIPILLAVWAMHVVTKALHKIIPKYLHYFLVPVLSLVIVLPITLLFFGPIGMWLGDGLNFFFEVLRTYIGNWIVVVLYAAFQPFLIVFGAGNFTAPIILNFLATQGYDPIILHAATISDLAVAGAMFGYFLRAKQSKEKQFFGTVSFSALMGITEPAVFGAFLKYRRPFVAVAIGGAIGGLIAGLTGVRTLAYAWGLAGLPTYLADGDVSNLIFMLISVVVGFVVAAGVAYGIGIPNEEVAMDRKQEQEDRMEETKKFVVGNVAKGTIVPLHEVKDQAFASNALGAGVGIVPTEDHCEVLAPVDGVVSVVFPTKHAYGIQTEAGVEILIHIGIDTVNLNGEYFESFVKQGQKVNAKDVLATYEVDKLKAEGFDPTIIVVVTNTMEYLDVIPSNTEDDNLLTIII